MALRRLYRRRMPVRRRLIPRRSVMRLRSRRIPRRTRGFTVRSRRFIG